MNKIRFQLLGIAGLTACSAATVASAGDYLSFIGATGALTTPTASIIGSGEAGFQANNNQRSADAIRKNGEPRNYTLAIGLLPRIELTGQVSVEEISSDGGFSDLSTNLKAALFQSDNFDFSAGALDIAGDAQNFSSKYVVGTTRYKMFSITAGYGNGQALDGAFGSIKFSPISHISLLADYDGREYSAGSKFDYSFNSGFTLVGTAKLYSSAKQKTAFGISLYHDLDFRKDQSTIKQSEQSSSPFFNGLSNGDGLRNLSVTSYGTNDHAEVRAENSAYHQRQSDSDLAACSAGGSYSKNVAYQQLRYGIPVVETKLDCAENTADATQWRTTIDDFRQTIRDFSRIDAYGLELKLRPDLRSFAATEVGIFDYSLALLSTARVQLPAGLAAYVTYESPINSTQNFNDPFLFDFYRHRSGFREKQIQWAHHFLPGFFGLHSYGVSRQFTIDYKSQRNDFVWYIAGGQHQLYASEARYKPEDNPFLPKRELKYAGYRYWWLAYSTSIEADYGKYFYGDTGFRIKASRHFGDTIVSLYLKRADSENQVAGLQLSFPLTPRKSLNAYGASLVGTKRFDFERGTSFGQSNGKNQLKPLLMVEPQPSYQLRTDWLDNDRLFPAYPASDR